MFLIFRSCANCGSTASTDQEYPGQRTFIPCVLPLCLRYKRTCSGDAPPTPPQGGHVGRVPGPRSSRGVSRIGAVTPRRGDRPAQNWSWTRPTARTRRHSLGCPPVCCGQDREGEFRFPSMAQAAESHEMIGDGCPANWSGVLRPFTGCPIEYCPGIGAPGREELTPSPWGCCRGT